MIFTNGESGICVASKCGSQTLRHAGAENGWWEIGKAGSKDGDLIRTLNPVYCITRHPMLRMLSAWRMYFVRPVIHYRNHGDWSKVHRHLNADLAMPWIERHEADLFTHPVECFHKFLRRDLPRWLEVRDPHFKSMYDLYRPIERLVTVQYRSDFERVQRLLGWEPRHIHKGEWTWDSVLPEDFLIGAPELEHLEDDYRIYDNRSYYKEIR